MTARQFDLNFEIAIEHSDFSIAKCAFVARGQLPMNIFEPRYMAMVNYALATPTRLIGMVQPVDPMSPGQQKNLVPDLFQIGCAVISQPFKRAMTGDMYCVVGVNRFRLSVIDAQGWISSSHG